MNIWQIIGVGFIILVSIVVIILLGVLLYIAAHELVKDRGRRGAMYTILRISAVLAAIAILWFALGYVGHEIFGMEADFE